MIYNSSNEIIYLRDPKEFKINRYTTKSGSNWPKLVTDTYNCFFPTFNSYKSWSCFDNKGKQYDGYNGIHHQIIMFAGKIYPMVCIHMEKNEDRNTRDNWFYSMEEIEEFFEKYTMSFRHNRGRHFFGENSEKNLRNFFSTNYSVDSYTFLVENKISICVVSRDNIKFNVKLSDYDFYKKFDTYTAYQELDMWISGILSYPQNIMLEVDDKIKVTKHGFDNKYSFRTRPN